MTDVNANDRAIREVTESIDNFVELLTVRQLRNALKKGYRKVAAVSRKTSRATSAIGLRGSVPKSTAAAEATR